VSSVFNLLFAIRYRNGLTRNNAGHRGITHRQASLLQPHAFPCGIPQQVTFADVGHIAALAPELHDSLPLSCQRSPPRIRGWILFNTNHVQFAVAEFYALEFLGSKDRDRVVLVAQADFLLALGERLLPDRNQCLSSVMGQFWVQEHLPSEAPQIAVAPWRLSLESPVALCSLYSTGPRARLPSAPC
jgi:hypothetical protein